MIKVGQIYKVPYLGGKVVITWIRGDKTEFHMVRDDGFFLFSKDDEMGKDSVLLAEYPTWQEAVNSKEFNDGYKTDREIELEKDIDRLSDRNAKLEKMLYIAVKALEEIVTDESCAGCMDCLGSVYAEKALAKISEVKK